MRTSTGTATRAQRKRFERMAEIGCICSILDGRYGVPGHIHHILSGGTRLGHDYTICLSPWFHVGQPPGDWTIAKATDFLGPSMAHNPRRFKERYGTEMELLEFQNELLSHYHEREITDEE